MSNIKHSLREYVNKGVENKIETLSGTGYGIVRLVRARRE